MSAIAGAYARNGAPVERDVLVRLSQKLRRFGPDGERLDCSTSVGMVWRPFFTGPASRQRHDQPLADSEGHMIVWDGRLDNAAEVQHRLGSGYAQGQSPVELALSVYRRWGVEGFGHLVGDFALALWDPHHERMVLCCDSMGRRPLYYHLTPEHLFWSSSAQSLLTALDLSCTLDEEFVADFLANKPSSCSPFRGIRLLPGGHVLVVERGRPERLHRYWSFDPDHRITYRSDGEYEEHFAELFGEAVACRMPKDAPVFCELSGGVDSSSIACVADLKIRHGEVRTPDLLTVSHVFDEAASSDERPYIRLVEEQIARRGLHLSEVEHPLFHPLPDGFSPDSPTGEICFLSRQDRVTREMRSRGARVLLSGMGGDQLFWSQPSAGLLLGDLLARRRIGELMRQCRIVSGQLRTPLWRTFWRGAVTPLLPRKWQARRQRHNPAGEWLDPAFVRRTKLPERLLTLPDDLGFALPSSARQYGMIRQAVRVYALEPISSIGYVDVRYPYLDRRLVEFALAIPLEQKVRLTESRSIVRRGLKGVVPEAIRTRTSKAGPSEAVYRALAREWPRLSRLMDDPLVAAYGFVEPRALRTILNRARHGVKTNTVQLLRTFSLELWLRTLQQRPLREGDTAPPGWRQTPFQGGIHAAEAELRTA